MTISRYFLGLLIGDLSHAITKRDYVVIQGLTVFIAFVYVLINTAVDFIYIAVDPRIRSGRS